MSKAKGAAAPAVPAATSEENPKVLLVVSESGERETELVFELLRGHAPKGAEHFRQLIVGATTADKKNPRTIGYADTPIFRATDYMIQGGDTTATALEAHPPQGYKGQETTFGAPFEDEHVWDALPNRDAFAEECFLEVEAKDVDALKKMCIEKGCGGFSVAGGRARLKKRTAGECYAELAEAEETVFHLCDFGPSAPKHEHGTLSLANSGPDTNASQFIVTTKPSPWLDGRHTIIGKLVSGDLTALHKRMLAVCNPTTFLTPNPQAFLVQSCSVVETAEES